MKIVYYTSGTSGVGRLVHGGAIFNALKRKDTNPDFTILSSCPPERARILNKINIPHIEIPKESEFELLSNEFQNTLLYQRILELKPDVLIIDRMWFTLYKIIEEFTCKKIFICSQVIDKFFKINLKNSPLAFKPDQYDKIISIEPFKSPIQMELVNPLIIKNKNEIMSKDEARTLLGVNNDKKTVFVGVNFKEGYLDEFKSRYSYLENENYNLIYSTNINGEGIFPVADYYNAIDLLICSATYNFFWETRYFNKKAYFETVPVNFCNQEKRLNECYDYTFSENGADQLADILLNL
ncbi:MAG: hypothetical protein JXN64_07245 [Spirochaetes bacterium]|nr:hypothetical protein [Spirochaetota bacterium]